MLESKLDPFCCAGTSIHCLFCCGKHIFRPLWGKVPRSYRPVSASVYIIVLQLYERTKHDHIDRNVCFLFVKIKCILLLLKLNSAFIQLFIHLVWTLIFISPHSLRIIIFLGVELCWNIYPSTAYSSLLLLFLHISVLLGIWFSPTEYPYIDKRTWQIYQEVTGQYEASL